MASILLAKYDPLTGKILQKLTVPAEDAQYHYRDNPYLVEGDPDFLTDYVFQNAIHARPTNPAILNGHVLSALPAPCKITINKIEYDCKDVTADLDFTYPGVYAIRVSAWPYLDKDFTVTV